MLLSKIIIFLLRESEGDVYPSEKNNCRWIQLTVEGLGEV